MKRPKGKSLLDMFSERFFRLGNRLDNARTIANPAALRVMRSADTAGLVQYLRDTHPAIRQEALKELTDEELDAWQTVIQLAQLLRQDSISDSHSPTKQA